MSPVSITADRSFPNAERRSRSDASRRGPLFYLVVLCIVLEYMRPQEFVPGLSALRLPLLTETLLIISLLLSGRLSLRHTQTKLFLALFALMAVHVPLATNNFWAFWTLYGLMATFFLYLGVIAVARTPADMQALMSVWLVIHVGLAVYGLATGGRGIGGFIGDENDFALTINMAIPIAYFLRYTARSKVRNLLLLGAVAVFTLTTMVTFSRGGFIGLLAIGLYVWLGSPRKLRSALVVMFLVLIAVALAPKNYGDRIRSITEEGTTEGTAEDRIYEWKIGMKMFADNPLIGVGQGNFPYRFADYEGEQSLRGRSRAGRAAHSIYITLLAELGLIGAGIIAAMVWATLKDLRRLRRMATPQSDDTPVARAIKNEVRAFRAAMVGSLIAYFVGSIFISTLYYPNYWLLTAFCIALIQAYQPVLDAPAASTLVRR